MKNQIAQEKTRVGEIKIDIREFQKTFVMMKDLLSKGLNECKKRIIDMFVNRVIVYHDRIEVFLNTIPNSLFGNLIYQVEPNCISFGFENREKHNEKEPEIASDSCSESWLANPLGSPGLIRTDDLSVNRQCVKNQTIKQLENPLLSTNTAYPVMKNQSVKLS